MNWLRVCLIMVLLATFLVVLSPSVSAFLNGTVGVMASYHFDLNVNDSHDSYHGTNTGTVSNVTVGKEGNAILYGSPNSYSEFPIAHDWVNGDNISLSFWFNQTSNVTNKEFFGFYGLSGYYSELHITSINNNTLRIGIWQDGGGNSYRYWDSATNITRDNSSWHLLVFRHQFGLESSTQVYVDNNSIAGSWGGDALTSPIGYSDYLRIGTYPLTGSPESMIDEVVIWNRLLSVGEIGELYNSSYGIFYPFDAENQIFLAVKDGVTGLALSNVTAVFYNSSYSNSTLLGDGTITYTHLLDGDYNLQLSKVGYASSSQTLTLSVDTPLSVTAYLFNETIGTVIYVRNRNTEYLSDIPVTVTRDSDGVVMGTKTTDFSGATIFYLPSGYYYHINISGVSGYRDFYAPLTPIESTYTVTLEDSGTVPYDYYVGLIYNFTPSSGSVLSQNNVYQFYFNFSNSVWNISWCGLVLKDENQVIVNRANSTNCLTNAFLGINKNITDNDTVYLTGTLEFNRTINISFNEHYLATNYTTGEFSLSVALTNLGSFSKAGFGALELLLIALLVVVSVVVRATEEAGYVVEGDKVLLLIFCVTLFFSLVGWLTLPFVVVPWIADYGVVMIIGFLTFVPIIIKWAGVGE